MLQEKYDEGYIAFIENKNICDCPYKDESPEANKWVEGYHDAMDADADAWYE